MARKLTARQKLYQEHDSYGKIVKIPPKMQKRFGKGTMLIPKPTELQRLLRSVRKGKLTTLSNLRARLAEDASVSQTCPMTTGIFLRIIAEAAEEDRRDGKKRIVPYWRVLRDNGALIDKFPPKPGQQHLLEDEGFDIVVPARGKVLKVCEFESFVTSLT